MLNEMVYIYDDGTHKAEVAQLEAFFLGLDVQFKVLDAAQDAPTRQAVAAWQDVATASFPIVRIGEKIRALFFKANPNTLAPAYAPGVGMPLTGEPVSVYSAGWCPDCRHLESYLTMAGVPYTKTDIEQTDGAPEQIIRWSGGRRVVPTVKVGTAALLFNPAPQMLGRLLGV
ncbi:MAG: glutaredoxin family protein [Acidobacteriota bacterium]